MSEVPVRCGDAEALMDFLYDECEPDARARMTRHLAACAACSEELASLGGARQELAAWMPPALPRGFQISSASAAPAPVTPVVSSPAVAWWRQPMPAWGQAVAAVALFGLGMAAGGRSGNTPATGERTGTAAAVVSASDLAQVESRLRGEIDGLRTAATASPRSTTVAVPVEGHEAAVMRQVRQLLRESEGRQQETFEVRAAQLARDAEIQRRVDQANLQRTLTQVQGTTGEEVRQQRELLNYLVNVSQRGTAR
jgi:hypothetical protein